ncbi:non-specific serine/threonine protein kinase [Amniculicola lignicola CBS 123094]|uniref:non-specific serine/threonine protein kinase n=1 Tax=Amniculicola lignicola CBS 123094 TaxID=1392246 RepID=A0A6A5X216_9PLEO|nr:non-specific serine/threonine protein kinase [Amniculicola lignicola CBS 123094]
MSLATAKMDPGQPFEEERLPWYNPDKFYPVRIGEILDSSYKVLGKLGYGAYSTVWLCRNTRDVGFVAIKVCTRDFDRSARIHRELQFYKHVSSLNSQHHGQSFVRGLLGTFEITGPTGQHLCLVHPPMHMTIQELQYRNQSHRLNEPLLKWTLSNLLNALSFLHDEAKVVHTELDINPSNIMLTVADESVLHDFEKAEAEKPSPAKVIDDVRTIYGSRKLGLPRDSLWGQPVLCDFGEARIGKSHRGLIQPDLYRAPEVLFEMEWSSSADIWNVAALIWDLFENRHLFNAIDENLQPSATHHVAEMVAYLGLPYPEYIQRSEITKKVFDEQGRWKGAGGTVVPQLSLEESISALDGETKEQFLNFIRSMLKWSPEKRKQASELLQDPWMTGAIP